MDNVGCVNLLNSLELSRCRLVRYGVAAIAEIRIPIDELVRYEPAGRNYPNWGEQVFEAISLLNFLVFHVKSSL